VSATGKQSGDTVLKIPKGIKPYYQTDLGFLVHGDCLQIMPMLEPVDLVLTDPPYGLKENAHRVASRTKLAKIIDYGDFDWDKEPADKEKIDMTVGRAKNSIIWGGNYFHLPPSRGWLVWDKLNSGNFADAELAWTNLKMSVRLFKYMWNGMIREERHYKRTHPAQKPIALMIWCLEFCQGSVLDPFMGSGTTAVACERLNRRWIGIEISEAYCEIAKQRIEKERSQLKLF